MLAAETLRDDQRNHHVLGRSGEAVQHEEGRQGAAHAREEQQQRGDRDQREVGEHGGARAQAVGGRAGEQLAEDADRQREAEAAGGLQARVAEVAEEGDEVGVEPQAVEVEGEQHPEEEPEVALADRVAPENADRRSPPSLAACPGGAFTLSASGRSMIHSALPMPVRAVRHEAPVANAMPTSGTSAPPMFEPM